MKRSTILAAAAATVLGASLSAQAQSANFVLFGDANPDAAKQKAEDKFVHPVTSPYYHEDSFVTSDVRAWFVWHDFPGDAPIDGGDAQVYALQVRLALTDSLQLVAYKDGFLDINSGLVEEDGWNDIAAGLKWAFLQDYDNALFAAVGVGYEFPLGSPSVFQNDDDIRVWASVNKGIGALHLGATANVLIPLSDSDSLRFYWNAHLDYWLTDQWSVILEANGYHTLDDGDARPPFSGVDVFDIGGGPDVVTGAFGAAFRVNENLEFRAAGELPLTQNDDDLWGWRITASAVYSF